MQNTTTFLMFDGQAEEAMNFYVSVFPNSEITQIARYGDELPHVTGKVVHGRFTINGTEYIAMDTAVEHRFGFTPSVSIFVTCDSEAEVDELYSKLSDGGSVLMELAKYDFSDKYAWINDKYGVSWQLFLAK